MEIITILKLMVELFKNRKEISDIREMLSDREFKQKIKELYRSGAFISFRNDRNCSIMLKFIISHGIIEEIYL